MHCGRTRSYVNANWNKYTKFRRTLQCRIPRIAVPCFPIYTNTAGWTDGRPVSGTATHGPHERDSKHRQATPPHTRWQQHSLHFVTSPFVCTVWRRYTTGTRTRLLLIKRSEKARYVVQFPSEELPHGQLHGKTNNFIYSQHR
jgi:hypothetical protein